MEQKVGRVDRINSFSWRTRRPVEIIYVWQPGTYEERIVQAVENRLVMVRTLLGAGQWLSDDPETQRKFEEIEKYQLSFKP